MLNAFAGGHPLHISVAVSARCAEAIGMINKAFSDHRNGFKTTMWMTRKARDGKKVNSRRKGRWPSEAKASKGTWRSLNSYKVSEGVQ